MWRPLLVESPVILPVDEQSGAALALKPRLNRLDHRVRCDPELPVEFFVRRGCSEAVHADEPAIGPDPAVPSVPNPGLDGDSCKALAQDLPAIALALVSEKRKTWKGDNPRSEARRLELVLGLKGDLDFRSGGENRRPLGSARRAQDVSPSRDEIV